ncbi:MAG: hypothetical protein V7L22_25285 [Nostoc sp.]
MQDARGLALSDRGSVSKSCHVVGGASRREGFTLRYHWGLLPQIN